MTDHFDDLCDFVSEAMQEPADTAELQIERRIDGLVREMDEICALANNPETRDLIEKEAIGVGQILFRAQLALSFLAARKPPSLKIVQNNG